MKSNNFSYWLVAIVLGSLVNMSLFLFLPAIGRTAPPKKPQVIKMEFMAWQQPVRKKISPPEKIKKQLRPLPKPKPKPKPEKKEIKPVPKPTPKPKNTPRPVLSEKVIPEKAKPKPQKKLIEKSKIVTSEKAFTPKTEKTTEAELPTPIPIFKLTSLPRMLHRKTPVYPPEMKQAGRESTVKLEVLLDVKGLVRKVSIKKSGGEVFDLAAIEAIKNSTFMPANIDGKPVAVLMSIPVRFRLR